MDPEIFLYLYLHLYTRKTSLKSDSLVIDRTASKVIFPQVGTGQML